MAIQIERVEIRNYRIFKNAVFADIPRFSVLTSFEKSGGAPLFDVFSFVKDALAHDVSRAVESRGGFDEIVRQDGTGPISLGFKFRESGGNLATYELTISNDDGFPIVERELFTLSSKENGEPWPLIDLSLGKGTAGAEAERKVYDLGNPAILAIKKRGQLPEFRVVSEFRDLIENLFISDLHLGYPCSGDEDEKHLSPGGENLAQVAQFLWDFDRDRFNKILETLKRYIPGLEQIEIDPADGGRLTPKFADRTFRTEDGPRKLTGITLAMFAYFALLYGSRHIPLLAVNRPDTLMLFEEFMACLFEEFREFSRRGAQVLISVGMDFFAGLKSEEIYSIDEQNGSMVILKASETFLLRMLLQERQYASDLARIQKFLSEKEAREAKKEPWIQ